MKLPWDRNYLKISFYVAFTLVLVYALIQVVDLFAYVFTNIPDVFGMFQNVFGWIFQVFSVVIIGFVIAYVFDPLANFFQNKFDKLANKKLFKIKKVNKDKKKKSPYKQRIMGAVCTYLLVFAVIGVGFYFFVNKISSLGSGDFIGNISILINNSINDFTANYYKLENKLIDWGIYSYISDYITTFIKGVTNFVKNLGTSTISIITSIGSSVVNIFIGIVIGFYFIKDKESFIAKINNTSKLLFPKKVYETTKIFLSDCNAIFSGYIRGTLIDAMIMAILIFIILSVFNVDFAIIIGIISGFSNVIPYFGAIIGFVLAVSVALVNGSPMTAVYVGIAIIILQQIDSNIIVPKVVGESVELSPVLVIIALTVFGQMFGIAGMIFAVPVFAILKLMLNRLLTRRKNRSFQNI